jgi:hypothetical protein
MIQNGDKVEDIVTGVKGIVVCYSTYLTGCDRVSIQAKAMKDGQAPNWHMCDINSVRLLEKGKITIVDSNTPREERGGPQPSQQIKR